MSLENTLYSTYAPPLYTAVVYTPLDCLISTIVLLEKGADPNEVYMDTTPWQAFLIRLCMGPGYRYPWKRAIPVKKICSLFIDCGADLSVICRLAAVSDDDTGIVELFPVTSSRIPTDDRAVVSLSVTTILEHPGLHREDEPRLPLLTTTEESLSEVMDRLQSIFYSRDTSSADEPSES
jgi:hypothetical protein